MVSNARDDLPDPLTPVNTTSCRCCRVRSTPLRLWVRAPRTTNAREGLAEGVEVSSDMDATAALMRKPPSRPCYPIGHLRAAGPFAIWQRLCYSPNSDTIPWLFLP